jgi:GNAT superfamily N-acetyltransferase
MTAIARATLDDAAAILALQKRAYESEARLYDDWAIPPLTQTLESLREEIAAMCVLQASQDGVIVGSVRGREAEGICQIGRLMVEPRYQGQGLGSALLAAIESQFPAPKCFELFTGSRSEANIRLYLRHGYEVVTMKQHSPQVTLVYMSKVSRSG